VIGPADEHAHAVPDGAPANWQENWFFMGWSDVDRTGFYLHAASVAERVEVKAMTISDGTVGPASVFSVDHIDDVVQVVRPFERIDLRAGGLDVSLQAISAPLDWSALLAGMGVAGTERDHYEQGFRWGDGGLCVRDHTWGARDYSTFDTAWWTPMVFADGTYVSGVVVTKGDASVGGGFLVEGEGVTMLDDYAVTISEGEPDSRRYRQARVTGGPVEATADVRVHVPVGYPGFGLPFLSSEGLSTVRWNGRVGFGSVEINRAQRDDDQVVA
jgi:hypothetical protein